MCDSLSPSLYLYLSLARAHTHTLSHTDTEGAERQVLEGIDWTAVTISVIILEMMQPNAQASLLLDLYLRQRGYFALSFSLSLSLSVEWRLSLSLSLSLSRLNNTHAQSLDETLVECVLRF